MNRLGRDLNAQAVMGMRELGEMCPRGVASGLVWLPRQNASGGLQLSPLAGAQSPRDVLATLPWLTFTLWTSLQCEELLPFILTLASLGAAKGGASAYPQACHFGAQGADCSSGG